jgi:hypothetical protein
MNGREIVREGQVLCKSCAGMSYYGLVTDFTVTVMLPAGVGTRIHAPCS